MRSNECGVRTKNKTDADAVAWKWDNNNNKSGNTGIRTRSINHQFQNNIINNSQKEGKEVEPGINVTCLNGRASEWKWVLVVLISSALIGFIGFINDCKEELIEASGLSFAVPLLPLPPVNNYDTVDQSYLRRNCFLSPEPSSTFWKFGKPFRASIEPNPPIFVPIPWIFAFRRVETVRWMLPPNDTQLLSGSLLFWTQYMYQWMDFKVYR